MSFVFTLMYWLKFPFLSIFNVVTRAFPFGEITLNIPKTSPASASSLRGFLYRATSFWSVLKPRVSLIYFWSFGYFFRLSVIDAVPVLKRKICRGSLKEKDPFLSCPKVGRVGSFRGFSCCTGRVIWFTVPGVKERVPEVVLVVWVTVCEGGVGGRGRGETVGLRFVPPIVVLWQVPVPSILSAV